MRLQDAASTDFLLVDKQPSAAQLAEWLHTTKAAFVVAVLDSDHAWLWPAVELSPRLAKSPQVRAFDILAGSATPDRQVAIADGDLSTDAAPDRCVVAEDGIVMGVYDRRWLAGGQPSDAILIGRQTRGGPVTPESLGKKTGPCVLQAEFPAQLALGETRSLLVSVLKPAGGDDSIDSLPVGTDIDVILQARQGLEVFDRSESTLQLAAADDDAQPVRFQLRARDEGTAKLRVLAFHDGQLLGSVTVVARVGPAAQEPAPSTSSSRALRALSASACELTLLILEERTPPGYVVYLHATDPSLDLNFRRFGPIALKSNARGLFDEFFEDIEQFTEAPGEPQCVQTQLGQRGSWLFEKAFPADLRELIWMLRNRITTVQIQSDEPWIPWEMCKLQGMENGLVVEGPFFCEAFALTRWMPGVPLTQELSLAHLAVVAPTDSHLTAAGAEKDYLETLKGANREVRSITADYGTLLSAFASGQYDGFHFIGHGVFGNTDPNLSAISLESGKRFRPSDIAGVARNLGRKRPLIFFNACQTGRSDFSLTDIGGWSGQFLRAGAGAFVGSYWSVFDSGAALFARTFYDRLLQGVSIGHATRDARHAVKATGDPSFLAYTVYAVPGATLKL